MLFSGNTDVEKRLIAPTKAWPAFRLGALAFILAALLYGCTAAPGVLWGDSGQIQWLALKRIWLVDDQICRSHIAHLALIRAAVGFSPFSAAYTANLVSVFFGICTVSGLAWVAARLTGDRLAAGLATLLYAVAHTPWRLALIAEVQTMATALMIGQVVALIRYVDTGRRWNLGVAAGLSGLSLSTNPLGALLLPAWLIFALYRGGRRASVGPLRPAESTADDVAGRPSSSGGSGHLRLAAMVGGAFFLGLLPILWLTLSYYRQSGSGLDTFRSFLIGRYANRFATVETLPRLLLLSLGYVALNFPTPLVFAVAPGIRRALKEWPREIFGFLAVSGVACTAFAVAYGVPDQYSFFPPAYLFGCLFLAEGIKGMRRWLRPWPLLLLSAAAPALYLVGVPLLRNHAPDLLPLPRRESPYIDRFAWYLQPWLQGYDGPQRFAENVLAVLPPDGWFGDESALAAPILYLQTERGLRPDVIVPTAMNLKELAMTPEEAVSRAEAAFCSSRFFVASQNRSYWPRWLRDREVNIQPVGPLFLLTPKNP